VCSCRNCAAGCWMAWVEMVHIFKIMNPDVGPWHLRFTPLDSILYVSQQSLRCQEACIKMQISFLRRETYYLLTNHWARLIWDEDAWREIDGLSFYWTSAMGPVLRAIGTVGSHKVTGYGGERQEVEKLKLCTALGFCPSPEHRGINSPLIPVVWSAGMVEN
jgi:hypothetical protein